MEAITEKKVRYIKYILSRKVAQFFVCISVWKLKSGTSIEVLIKPLKSTLSYRLS